MELSEREIVTVGLVLIDRTVVDVGFGSVMTYYDSQN
jgi:hypothetical protein